MSDFDDSLREAFVLLTAMPPTIGHARLVEFASYVASSGVTVIVTTQPGEPYAEERFRAVAEHFRGNYKVKVQWLHRTIPQDPATPGFRGMWRDIMVDEYGFQERDYIVASEPYGAWLAAMCGGVFMPYDISRSVTPVKASAIREDPARHWNEILPEFRRFLVATVTFFGAESVGKTTFADFAGSMFPNCSRIPEYARPYLETVGNEITPEKMENIANGQAALQVSAFKAAEKPVLAQDTDLYSTVGYYGLYEPAATPDGLWDDAAALKSDVYIVLSTEGVPFEPDPLRYGGHQRESDDDYWISLCHRHDLNYFVLRGTKAEREAHVIQILTWTLRDKMATMRYQREAND